jgi:hypothetical protein
MEMKNAHYGVRSAGWLDKNGRKLMGVRKTVFPFMHNWTVQAPQA